jgi:hypothetical protein
VRIRSGPEHLARVIGSALEPRHGVRVVAARDARALTGEGVDLLLVGAPTQMFGRRLLVRSFLDGLKRHGFTGLPAAAFDTRMGTPTQKNAAEAEVIAKGLQAASCRLVVPPESFLVAGFEGTERLSRNERVGLLIHRQLDKRLSALGVGLYRLTRGAITRPWKVDALLLAYAIGKRDAMQEQLS